MKISFKFKDWFKKKPTSSTTSSSSASIAKDDLEQDTSATDQVLIAPSAVVRHRRFVLNQARRYKSVFINTKQRIVVISFLIFIIGFLVFSSFVYWRLYRVQDNSNLMYNITRLIPLPVAKVGSSWVSYEDYLKDLKRQIHYFNNQQQIDLNQKQPDGAQITLQELKNNSMENVINKVYVLKLAQKYDLSVDEDQVEAYIKLLQSQNKLNPNQEGIEEVVQSYWGFSWADYRQFVRDKFLQDAVVRHMDKVLENNALQRMREVQTKLNQGYDFAQLAREYSEATSALNGGRYNFLLDLSQQQENPLVLKAAFETEVGQVSEIIDTGDRLEIIKILADEGDNVRRAAHIRITYLSLAEILKEGLLDEEKISIYINGVDYNLNLAD